MALSPKQMEILRFPYEDYDALICDGAVRAGKTSVMALSFLLWAMGAYSGQAFALCGRSIGAVERNILAPMMEIRYLKQNFHLSYIRTEHLLRVSRGRRENRFYLFGGKDESSAALIQGITLAGVLLDEVALMPRSFVEQALARCSVEGSKLWFNCNPEHPNHWFRREWILKAEEKRAKHLHFLLEDNPALDQATREKYHRLYTGVFYQRFILGQWVVSQGRIYDMFDPQLHLYDPQQRPPALYNAGRRTVAVDYGTVNPTVFLDIYDWKEHLYVDGEYRWDSRKEGRQKTDEDYADDMMAFLGRRPCTVLVDPSAASFIQALSRRGVYVLPAQNQVLDGIRRTGVLFRQGRLHICRDCRGLSDELSTYQWDQRAEEDRPVKENDHGPDALRYFVNSLAEWRFT